MKSAADPLRGYEYSFLQPEFVGSALKYANRAILAGGLRLWMSAQNPLQIPAAPEVELPSNPAPELLAEGYAAALEVDA
jgi:hypothetical protein